MSFIPFWIACMMVRNTAITKKAAQQNHHPSDKTDHKNHKGRISSRLQEEARP